MPTEDWIQESLARLESLEEERNRHEAALETSTDPASLRMNAQAVERLDAKIRSLYAELEAAAEQGDAEQGDADSGTELEADEDDGEGDDEVSGGTTRLFKRADVAAQAAVMQRSLDTVKQDTKAIPAKVHPTAAASVAAAAPAAAATPFAAPVSAPFGGAPATSASPQFSSTPSAPFGGGAPAASPFGNSASPFGEVPQSAPFGTSGSSDSPGFSSPSSASSFDAGNSYDDEPSSGSGSKMGLIIGAGVVVLGLVGYLVLGGKDETPAPAAPTGPVKVIGGMEVPPDTQGPKTVQGSSDAIKGTQYKEGRPQQGGGGGGSNTPRTNTEKPAKKDPRAKIENADDPLAGIDK